MSGLLLELAEPLIQEREKNAEIRGKIIGAVENLRNFISDEEIKTIIMEKYNLSENEAEKYL